MSPITATYCGIFINEPIVVYHVEEIPKLIKFKLQLLFANEISGSYITLDPGYTLAQHIARRHRRTDGLATMNYEASFITASVCT